MQNPKLSVLVLAIAIGAASEVRAAYAITYDFTGLTGATATVPAVPATVPPGVTALDLAHGFTIIPVAANDAYDSIGWNSPVRDDNKYYAFTIKPGSAPLNLASLVYTDRRSADGPKNFEVDYTLPTSLNFNLIGTYTLADDLNHRETFNLSGIAELQGLTKTATFYIFGFNTTIDSGAYRLGNGAGTRDPSFPDNLILNGDVQGVPEPPGVASLSIGLVALAGLSWRLRRRVA